MRDAPTIFEQDFEPSPPAGLDYLDLPASTDLRYSQETSSSHLTLDNSVQPSSTLNLYPSGHPPVYHSTNSYTTEGSGTFFPPVSSHLFPGIDVRAPRLGSSVTPSTGMAHARRPAALPHPGPQLATRDIYSSATPTFRRPIDHLSRSPPFPATLRHHPLSPTPSPGLGYTPALRMDANFGSKSQQTIPPLQAMTSLGSLHYTDGSTAGTPVKIEINGVIDKGFFLADNEWTCYRRNYFSCICSYSLSPYIPNSSMQFTQSSSQSTYQVFGFAMCISAVVADNDGHAIELVQHTPKRDKGPIARPEKVRLTPKPPQTSHHPLGIFNQADSGLSGRYDGGFANSQGSYPSEHTFERIQFKQATANNGKRRAAQQYYHLLVELYADVGKQSPEQFLKIAFRKSAKMIVRGRSPGHYQSERRGSASSGPGGSAGSIGYGGSQLMGSEFGSQGPTMLSGNYGGGYDPRNANHYGSGTRHHHDMHLESIIPEDAKTLSETKDYQYFPAPIYEGSQDPRQPVEMFSHGRGEHDTANSHGSGGLDLSSKIKAETDASLPRLFYPPQSAFARNCGRFEGKSSSNGYYPTMMPSASAGLNMT